MDPHRVPPTSPAFQLAMRELRAELDVRIIERSNAARLAEMLARTAHEARTAGMQAEQLVVAFREIWNDARPGLSRAAPADLEDIRWRLVAELIVDYYANGDGDIKN